MYDDNVLYHDKPTYKTQHMILINIIYHGVTSCKVKIDLSIDVQYSFYEGSKCKHFVKTDYELYCILSMFS